MKAFLKRLVNTTLGLAGVRLVHRDWGPRGFASHLGGLPAAVKARISRIVDIGASDGKWTRECAKVFPGASYLLIDPLDENEPALRALCGQNPHYHYWMGALGAKSGQLELHVHGDQSSAFSSKEYGAIIRTVAMSTLDTLLAENLLGGIPDFIKLDVQGDELAVLAGAEEALKVASLVLIEVSFQRIYDTQPLADEVICFMRDHGYKILDLCSYAQRPLDGALCQADVLFAREATGCFSQTGWSDR
jgi:FkbM family methyltransferase